jgi:hypothetical protein
VRVAVVLVGSRGMECLSGGDVDVERRASLAIHRDFCGIKRSHGELPADVERMRQSRRLLLQVYAHLYD